MDELFDLSKFDEYRENNRIEVKKAKDCIPISLWETYSAFANCKGGLIILGVSENDDGSWYTTGLKDERKLLKNFWDTINNKAKVSFNLLSEKDVVCYTKDNDLIIVINVPRASREIRPIFLDNDMMKKTYRRNFEGDYRCSEAEVKGMLRDAPEDTYDMKVLSDMHLDVFNSDTIKQYRNMHNNHMSNHVWSKIDDIDYLERIGAAKISREDGKLHPTVAGLLMFGEEYKILYEFPEYFLDYREEMDVGIRWSDRIQSMSGDWSGNLFDFYFKVYPKLVKDLKIPFEMQGIFRIDDTPMHRAIREALANCLINTDFFFPSGVVIKKTEKYITFENPGSIRTGKDQMLKGGLSDPRNKALMKMFNLIGIGERAGSGVPNILDVWSSKNLETPIIKETFSPDRTMLILPLSEKIEEVQASLDLHPSYTQATPKLHPSCNKSQENQGVKWEACYTQATPKLHPSYTRASSDQLCSKIFEILEKEPEISQSKLAEKLSENVNTIKTYINKLKKAGIVERQGSSQKGKWIIIKK